MDISTKNTQQFMFCGTLFLFLRAWKPYERRILYEIFIS